MDNYKPVTEQEFKKFLELKADYNKVLVVFDGSEESKNELIKALNIYKQNNNKIVERLTYGNGNLQEFVNHAIDIYLSGEISDIQLVDILRILGCKLEVENAEKNG